MKYSILVLAWVLSYVASAFAFEPMFDARVDYTAGDGPYSVFSIDFDGDGDNDLATANAGTDNVSILLGNGDGTFQSAVNWETLLALSSLSTLTVMTTMTS